MPWGYAFSCPAGVFLGMHVEDQSESSVTTTMSTSRWFSMLRREVDPGILAAFGNHTATVVSTQMA